MTAPIPNELFTQQSFVTLAGATFITTVITNSCQHVFNWNPKWFGLVLGILIGLVGVIFTEDPKPINYVIGVLNGFLIYASAAGIMQMAGTQAGTTQPPTQAAVKRQFSNKWY